MWIGINVRDVGSVLRSVRGMFLNCQGKPIQQGQKTVWDVKHVYLFARLMQLF